MDEKIIPFDSPEAAQIRTDISGWVSSDGGFYGDDERAARYAGCTHRPCGTCGAIIQRSRVLCDSCRLRSELEKYSARPCREWDGVSMIYSEAADEYFASPDDAEDSLEEGETMEDLRLVICAPVYARQIDSDYFCDDLPDDGNLPAEIEAAIDAFNTAISGIILSWFPGKFALAGKDGEDA